MKLKLNELEFRQIDLITLFVFGFTYFIMAFDYFMGLNYLLFLGLGSFWLMVCNWRNKK